MLVPRRNDADPVRIAEHMLEAAPAPFEYEGIELSVSASVGTSRFPDNGLHTRLEVSAEGVETLPQLTVLRQAGCTPIQFFC